MSIPFFIINNYIAKNTMKSCLPWFLVCPFFNKFDKNVSTKMCPNRALHNLVTYCGRAKANFCRCFVDFDIEKFVQQKSASSYFAFFLHFLTRAFFSRMGPKHFCSGWPKHFLNNSNTTFEKCRKPVFIKFKIGQNYPL